MQGSDAPPLDPPSPIASRAPRWGLALLLVLCAAWSLLYVVRTSVATPDGRVFVLWDDGMISMRYAQNLAAGHGLVWNPGGERVQGFTNLGVTLFMAAVHRLPLGLHHTSLAVQLASIALLAGIVLVFHRLGEALFGAGSWTALGLAAACLLYAPLGIWTLQGSDVGAVALLVGLALRAFARAERDGRPLPPAAIFVPLALGLLVRLDVAIAFALFVGAALLRGRDGLRAAVVGALLGGLVLAGLLAFGWLYYGDPLPNTYYLKNTGTPRDQMWASGWEQTKLVLTAWSLPFHAIAALGALVSLRRRGIGGVSGVSPSDNTRTDKFHPRGTGRSSTGNIGSPVSRCSTNSQPILVACTTTGIERPSGIGGVSGVSPSDNTRTDKFHPRGRRRWQDEQPRAGLHRRSTPGCGGKACRTRMKPPPASRLTLSSRNRVGIYATRLARLVGLPPAAQEELFARLGDA